VGGAEDYGAAAAAAAAGMAEGGSGAAGSHDGGGDAEAAAPQLHPARPVPAATSAVVAGQPAVAASDGADGHPGGWAIRET
jgi:hypothetical protein